MQELRELNTKLEYEKSQLSDEGRRLDKIEDKIVGKDNVLKGMVREVGMVNQENVVMHKTEVSLERALKTTTDVAERGQMLWQAVRQPMPAPRYLIWISFARN